MRVMVAMSGGVDSSVAAARLVAEGHDVVGVTLKLWGGEADRGCCTVGDVDDAARVAHQLGIDHAVFNFGADFDRDVVQPYVADHAAGLTPNPCVACNRHVKFDLLLGRADDLGFDALATGHHARVVVRDGRPMVARGVDRAKDQSYVVHMLSPGVLSRVRFPVGATTKAAVRAEATELGLRTAAKPESQDTCFIPATGGRESFLRDRIPLSPAAVVDRTGREVGRVDAVQLVTVGQRRGLGAGGHGSRRYALDVDVEAGRVVVGERADLLVDRVRLRDPVWHAPVPPAVTVQCSAHGEPLPGRVVDGSVVLDGPAPRVAPGQPVVVYDGDVVIGGGSAR